MVKKDDAFFDSRKFGSVPDFSGLFLRTPYNYDRQAVSDETGLKCEDPPRTVQDGKDDADINVIMERYARTGQFQPPANLPQYGDFTSVSDFQSALNLVIQAESGFMQLPAKLRSRFHNDPAALLAFLDDPGNLSEAQELGIVPKAPPAVLGAGETVDKSTGEVTKPVVKPG